MAITKTTEIAKMEIVGEHKHVQVRTDTVIKEDGKEISRSPHRHVVHSGTIDGSDNFVDTDISGEAAEVQSICNAAWTDAVKDAYKTWLIANK